MTRRGPKTYAPGCGRLMPTRLIAQRLGVSVRTVNSDLSHALQKLRARAIQMEVR